MSVINKFEEKTYHCALVDANGLATVIVISLLTTTVTNCILRHSSDANAGTQVNKDAFKFKGNIHIHPHVGPYVLE